MTDKDPSEEDYLDASDFESDVDDLGAAKDFDEESEDGIFAPSGLSKKKSGSKYAIAGVVLVALLSGAAFYYFNQSSNPDHELAAAQAPEATATPIETASSSPVSPASDTSVSPVPTPASDFPADTAKPATPDVVPPDQTAATPVTDTTASSATLPEVTTANNATPPASTPAIGEKPPEVTGTAPVVAPSPDVPATSEEPKDNKTLTEQPPTIKLSDVPDVSSPPEVKDAPVQPDTSALASPVKEPPPVIATNVAVENPAKTPKKKDELEAAHETINTVSTPAPKTKYFDAPGSKALTDIPPPSINPMMEPGQSIIIVNKGKRVPDEGVVVSKGDDSEFIESRLVYATRAAKLGHNDAALDFYNELYHKNDHDPRILMGRAVTYQKLGENQKAVEGYKEVLEVEPENPEAMTNMMGLIGQSKPAVALQNLIDLHEKYPRNASVSAQLGVAYAQSGNPQDGLKYLDAASKLQPENPLHYYNMAVIAERLNARDKAIQYYEQALDAYSVYGSGTDSFSREDIYDHLAKLRGN